jgi:transposase InsO family protein
MTEANDCYENVIAKRVNGILKYGFYLEKYFQSSLSAKEAYDYSVECYNNKRFNLSLNYKTPQKWFVKMLFEFIV